MEGRAPFVLQEPLAEPFREAGLLDRGRRIGHEGCGIASRDSFDGGSVVSTQLDVALHIQCSLRGRHNRQLVLENARKEARDDLEGRERSPDRERACVPALLGV